MSQKMCKADMNRNELEILVSDEIEEKLVESNSDVDDIAMDVVDEAFDKSTLKEELIDIAERQLSRKHQDSKKSERQKEREQGIRW